MSDFTQIYRQHFSTSFDRKRTDNTPQNQDLTHNHIVQGCGARILEQVGPSVGPNLL